MVGFVAEEAEVEEGVLHSYIQEIHRNFLAAFGGFVGNIAFADLLDRVVGSYAVGMIAENCEHFEYGIGSALMQCAVEG